MNYIDLLVIDVHDGAAFDVHFATRFVAVDNLDIHYLFVALTDDGNQEVKKYDQQVELVEKEQQPGPHDHHELISIKATWWFLPNPNLISWSLNVTNGVSEVLEQCGDERV